MKERPCFYVGRWAVDVVLKSSICCYMQIELLNCNKLHLAYHKDDKL